MDTPATLPCFPHPAPSQDGRFRLVNYNVLSPYLANLASYPNVPPALLDRSYRFKAVTDKVLCWFGLTGSVYPPTCVGLGA